MNPKNLRPLKIENIHGLPQLEWATGLTFTLPQLLVDHLLDLGRHHHEHGLTLDINTIHPETIALVQNAHQSLRSHAIFTNRRPLASLLPINYQSVPSFIRDIIAYAIGRAKRSQESRWATFPRWPLDLSADFIADLSKNITIPKKSPTPVLLTHDIDSPEGLKNAVRYFLDIEEAVNARSANYIVPCNWPINHGLLTELQTRGHEIGIHGFDHSNKTPFLNQTILKKRLMAAMPLIKQYNIQGYRAPSLLRTRALIKELATLYRYDTSIPTSGGCFPIPNNGCASARPFLIEGIWELPLSMPRDGSLLFLGYSYQEILDTWIHCANLIAASGGIVNLLTHCEYRFSGKSAMRDIYKTFLSYLASSGKFQFMKPNDIIAMKEKHGYSNV